MSRSGAHRAVVISALVVFGTYFYRVLTEGHSSSGGSLLGVGSPPNVGRFITGWGFAFFVLSIITEAAPPLGGALSILVATGDVLANATQVTADVNKKLGSRQTQAALLQPLTASAGVPGPPPKPVYGHPAQGSR